MPGALEDKKRSGIFTDLLIALLFILAFIINSGCGKKAFPSAPSSMVPEPPKKFDVFIDKDKITVSWQLVSTENVKSVHIYRSRIPKSRFCATCPYTFEPVTSMPAEEQIYREKALSGYHYAFKIEVEGTGGDISTPRTVTLETQ